MRLSEVLLFELEAHAKTEIINMTKKEEDKTYFAGSFKHVCKDYYVFNFKKTLRPVDACVQDLKITLIPCDTNEVLPCAEQLFSLNVVIVCIAEEDIMQERREGRREGITDVWKKIAEEEIDEPTKKKIKIACDSLAGTSALVPIVAPTTIITTTPDENSTTRHIVAQMTQFATEHGLLVFNDKSLITELPSRNKFSKYAGGRPDITIYPKEHNKCTIVATKDLRESLYVHHYNDDEDDEDDDEDGEDDGVNDDGEDGEDDSLIGVTRLVGSVCLNVEAKPETKHLAKDPRGQLLAGMDKTLGDLFDRAMISGSLLSEQKMFGLHLVAEENFCEVIRADMQIGRPTVLHRGKTILPVKEAINRVFGQLLKAC